MGRLARPAAWPLSLQPAGGRIGLGGAQRGHDGARRARWDGGGADRSVGPCVLFARCAMGKINWGRVVLGGLLAGVVLNIVDFVYFGVIMKQAIDAAMQALGKRPGAMDSLGPLFVVVDFVTGIGLLWVYAAIRPRFGAGARTAVIAGVAVWFFVGLLHAIGEAPMGLLPQQVYTVGTVIALVQYAVAGAVGAYVYKE